MPSFRTKLVTRKKKAAKQFRRSSKTFRRNKKLRKNISVKKLYTKDKRFRRVGRGVVDKLRQSINSTRLSEADRDVVKHVVEQADKNVVSRFRKGIETIKRQRQKRHIERQLVKQFISGVKTLKKKRKEGQQRERTNIEKGNECAICLEQMTLTQATTRLDCGHKYHNECLKDSFQRGHTRCAICRQPISRSIVNNLLSSASSSQQAPPIIVSQEPRFDTTLRARATARPTRTATIAGVEYIIYDEVDDLGPYSDEDEDEDAAARRRARRPREVLEAFKRYQDGYQDDPSWWSRQDEATIVDWLEMVAPVEVASAATAHRAEAAATAAAAEAEAVAREAAVRAARAAGVGGYDIWGLIASVWLGEFREPHGWDNTSQPANLVRAVRNAKAAVEARGMVSDEMRVALSRRVETREAEARARAVLMSVYDVLEVKVVEALSDVALAAILEAALADESINFRPLRRRQ